jgi:hypothetical protein
MRIGCAEMQRGANMPVQQVTNDTLRNYYARVDRDSPSRKPENIKLNRYDYPGEKHHNIKRATKQVSFESFEENRIS